MTETQPKNEAAGTSKGAKYAHADGTTFWLLGEIGPQLNEPVIFPLEAKIRELKKLREAEIELVINSPGGESTTKAHVIGLMEEAKAAGIIVKTRVVAWAFSAASMIAVAGSRGHRSIHPNAEHLLHLGRHPWGGETTALQVERVTAYKQRHFERIVKHYKKHARVPKLRKKLKDDFFMVPAERCIEWGLADKFWSEA